MMMHSQQLQEKKDSEKQCVGVWPERLDRKLMRVRFAVRRGWTRRLGRRRSSFALAGSAPFWS